MDTNAVYRIHCAMLPHLNPAGFKTCDTEVVLPKMVKEDIDALLELNGWRPGPDGKWICNNHEEKDNG